MTYRNTNSLRINTYKKQGGGVIIANQVHQERSKGITGTFQPSRKKPSLPLASLGVSNFRIEGSAKRLASFIGDAATPCYIGHEGLPEKVVASLVPRYFFRSSAVALTPQKMGNLVFS